MTQPPPTATHVSLQRAWARLTFNMGSVNISRAHDARKAANLLPSVRTKR